MAAASATLSSFKFHYDQADAAYKADDDETAMDHFLKAIECFNGECDQPHSELFIKSVWAILILNSHVVDELIETNLTTIFEEKDYPYFLEKAQTCFERVVSPSDETIGNMLGIYTEAIVELELSELKELDPEQISQRIKNIKKNIDFCKKYCSKFSLTMELAKKLNELAGCFYAVKNYSDALTYYEQSNEILKKECFGVKLKPFDSTLLYKIVNNTLGLAKCHESLHQLDEAHRSYLWLIDFLFAQTQASFNVHVFYKVSCWFNEIYHALQSLVVYEQRYQHLFEFASNLIFIDSPTFARIADPSFEQNLASRASAFFKMYENMFSKISKDRRLANYLIQFMTMIDYFYSAISANKAVFLSPLDEAEEDAAANQIKTYVDRFNRFLSPAEFTLFKVKLTQLTKLRTLVDGHLSTTIALAMHISELHSELAALKEEMAQLKGMVSEHKRKSEDPHPEEPSAKRPAPMRFLSRSR